jgi:hypothetical protein
MRSLSEYEILLRTTGDQPRLRVAGLLEAFTIETGEALDQPITAEQVQRVRLWMVRRDMPTVARKEPTLRMNVHSSLAAKASWLAQAPCIVCDKLPNSVAAEHSTFTIPVPPFTKQNRTTARAVAKAMATEFGRTADKRSGPRTWEGLSICASVVAVQNAQRHIIDVDNAAKAVLDTLSKTVFIDDRHIQHLSAMRLQATDTTGYYVIGLRPVYPLEDDCLDTSGEVPYLGLVQPPAELT